MGDHSGEVVSAATLDIEVGTVITALDSLYQHVSEYILFKNGGTERTGVT